MRNELRNTLSIAAAVVVGLGVLGTTTLFLTTSMPTSSIAAEKTVNGRVIYRERIALPPEAKLTVQLLDISKADAPSSTIAETRTESAQGSPIPFAINFDTSEIKPGHTYALQARITAGDSLWFVNDQNYTVDTANPGEPVEIRVVMVRKSSPTPVVAGIENKDWLVEDIQGNGVIDNAQTTLTIASDGAVSGSGGCNRYFSKATVTQENLSFADIGSTYMQCPPALMTQERKFLDVLNKTRSYKIEPGGKLVLVDQDSNEMATLAPDL